MGLDMYLEKEIHVGANYEHHKVTGEVRLVKDGVPLNIKLNRVSAIIEEVAYWRKANAIHKWFVDNVQDGVDDCGRYVVSPDEVFALLDTVNRVLDNHDLALELLPPQEGFFFGSNAIDKWYWDDLEYTKFVLTNLVKEIEEDKNNHLPATLFYTSSW